jgi:hypothetical protein
MLWYGHRVTVHNSVDDNNSNKVKIEGSWCAFAILLLGRRSIFASVIPGISRAFDQVARFALFSDFYD